MDGTYRPWMVILCQNETRWVYYVIRILSGINIAIDSERLRERDLRGLLFFGDRRLRLIFRG